MQKKATNTRRKVKQKSVATARSKRNNKATKHRTEYRTAAGKKRYLKRKADGTITDNQSYKKSHGQDVKRRSKLERAKKKPPVKVEKPVRLNPAIFPDDDDLPLDGPPLAGIVEEVLDGDLVGDPSQSLDDALAAEAVENEDEVRDYDAGKVLGG